MELIFIKVSKKITFGQKNIFDLVNGDFGHWGAIKQPAERPNDYLPENWMYPELPQDMGEIWHHWVRSVWPKKSELYRRSVKKCRFSGQKNGPRGPPCDGSTQKCCNFGVQSWWYENWHWRTSTRMWKYNKYWCWFNSTAWSPKLAHCAPPPLASSSSEHHNTVEKSVLS